MTISYYIQAVPERLDYIKENLINEINFSYLPEINLSIDFKHKGSVFNMLSIFRNIKTDYALVLQDDVILPERFFEYIEKVVINEIKERGIDLLYLYVAPRKEYSKYPMDKVTYMVLTDAGQPAFIISKRLAELVINEYKKAKEKKHDDWLLKEICKKYKIKIYHHLPGIVQHNIYVKSAMGNPRNVKTKLSRMFNPNIIEKYLK